MRVLLAAAGLAALVFGTSAAAPAAGARLTGAGSTFVRPIMDKWIEEYAKAAPGVEITYQAQGSTAGVRQFIEKAADFGCTDAFLKKPDLDKAEKAGGPVLHVPLVMGAVVPAYNLDLDRPLNFTGDVLADIFLGKITRWNDPRLVELNKDVALPDLPVAVVHRVDGSGTTNIFTSYLSKVSSDWKDSRGAGTSIDWKGVGSAENGNGGVEAAVRRTRGAVGYIELTYALLNKDTVKYGAVRNREGRFVLADPKSVAAAAAGVLAAEDVPDDLRFSLVDAPGADSYPISGATWAVLYQDQTGGAGKDLVDFLTWVVHDGQQYAEPLHYAPLPEALVRRIDEKLKTVKTGR